MIKAGGGNGGLEMHPCVKLPFFFEVKAPRTLCDSNVKLNYQTRAVINNTAVTLISLTLVFK